MMIEKMLDLLPNSTNKPGIRKIFELAALPMEESESTFEKLGLWRDIDEAEGVALDRIGKDVGQLRKGMTDERYRKNIKLKIRANLSGGEIETLNAIFTLLIGDKFKGLEEGWEHHIQEPAALVMEVAPDVGELIDPSVIRVIKAGGVGMHQMTKLSGHTLRLIASDYNFEVGVPIAAMHHTSERPGIGDNMLCTITESWHTSVVEMPICGTEFHAGEGG